MDPRRLLARSLALVCSLSVFGFALSQPSQTVKDIFARMYAMYAGLKSYSDTGTSDVNGRTLTFKTFYKAPGALYFETNVDWPYEFDPLDRSRNERHVFWTVRKTRPLEPAQADDALINAYYSNNNAVIHDLPITALRPGGAAWLFFREASEAYGREDLKEAGVPVSPGEIFIMPLGIPKDVKLEGTEHIDGHECFVVSSESEQQTLWIDAETLVLRKEADGPRRSVVTVIHPTLNPTVEDSIFEFAPPIGAIECDWEHLPPDLPPPPPTAEQITIAYQDKDPNRLFDLASLAAADWLSFHPSSYFDDPKGLDTKAPGPASFSQELRGKVKASESALDILAKAIAFQLPRLKRGKYQSAYATRCPRMASLSRFASISGELAWSEGRLDEAVRDQEMSFEIGARILELGDERFQTYLGFRSERGGRRGLERVCRFLIPQQQIAVANFLLRQDRTHRPFEEVAAADTAGQIQLIEGLRSTDWKDPKDIEGLREYGDLKTLEEQMRLLSHQTLEMLRRPFQSALAQRRSTPTSDNAREIFLEAVSPAQYVGGWYAWLRNAADDRLLAVEFAALAYRADNKRWPVKMEDLRPGYLFEIPDDPFHPWHPLGLFVKGDHLVIYSVGPDGVDDRGTPAPVKPHSLTAKGDLAIELSSSN